MKPLTMQFPLVSCSFLPIMTKNLPQHTNIEYRQPIFLPQCERPSWWKTERQKILDRTVASIPWVQTPFNFFTNEVLISYHVFELCHTFKGFITDLYAVIFYCMQPKVWFLLFLKHDFQFGNTQIFQTMFAKSKHHTFYGTTCCVCCSFYMTSLQRLQNC